MTNDSDHRDIEGRQLSFIGLFQEFAAKLVLEVFGGGGAIWGFSEVCGLRTKEAESIQFWRSVALTVAVLFGVRWLRQLHRAASSLMLQKPQVHHHGAVPLGRGEITLETPTKDDSFTDNLREKSPLGIQLSSVLFGSENGNDEEEALLQVEAYDESTALATSPRSPRKKR